MITQSFLCSTAFEGHSFTPPFYVSISVCNCNYINRDLLAIVHVAPTILHYAKLQTAVIMTIQINPTLWQYQVLTWVKVS